MNTTCDSKASVHEDTPSPTYLSSDQSCKYEPLTNPYKSTVSTYSDTTASKRSHRYSWFLRQEEKSGVNGGNFEAMTWVPRKLNSIDGFSGLDVALSQNPHSVILLKPGMYSISASAPALGVGLHQIRLQNLTDNVSVGFGTSSSSNSDEHTTRSELNVYVRVSESEKAFQLQHKCSVGRPDDGLGQATNLQDNMEVYSLVTIQKLL